MSYAALNFTFAMPVLQNKMERLTLEDDYDYDVTPDITEWFKPINSNVNPDDFKVDVGLDEYGCIGKCVRNLAAEQLEDGPTGFEDVIDYNLGSTRLTGDGYCGILQE